MDNSVGIIIINKDNTEEEIQKCISSIKSQTYKNLKVISIGGNHNKAEIINKGLETIAKTDYVLLIEGQQILFPTYIEDTLKTIINHSVYVGAVYTDYFNIINDNNIPQYLTSFDRKKITDGYTIPNTALFKREVFDKCGSYNPNLNVLENWDIWLRISEKYVLYHLPKILYSNIEKENTTKIEDFKISKDIILSDTIKRVKTNG